MKIALLFPGQGAQYAGMGKDFFENEKSISVFEQAKEILGYDLKKVILEGTDEELRQTRITQPAIFIVSVLCYNTFISKLPDSMKTTISHTAGHSLGEYSALYASGVFDFSTGLKLVKKRAEFIQSVSEKNKGAMAAVIGLTQEQVQQVCKEVTAQGILVEPVNYNSNEQTVISGTVAGVEKAVELAKQIAGTNKLFKTVVLNVSGAFHSSLMKEAADNMGKELSGTVLSDAKIPVISNYDGTGTVNAGEIKSKLEKQINHAVLWVQAINNLAGLGVDTVVELGPGKVLSGLVKRINRNISIYNIEDTITLNKTLEGLIKQESTL